MGEILNLDGSRDGCGNCVFAHVRPNGWLACRRFPPQAHPIMTVVEVPNPEDESLAPVQQPTMLGEVALFPRVQPDMKCGEHKKQMIFAANANSIPKIA